MKLFTVELENGRQLGDMCDAVTHVADKATRLCEGELERVKTRHDALENMLGNLLTALAGNGVLRAEQFEAVFNGDAVAED